MLYPFYFYITSRTFVIRSIIWILLVLYITYPTLYGSGQDRSLDFHTRDFGWNAVIFIGGVF